MSAPNNHLRLLVLMLACLSALTSDADSTPASKLRVALMEFTTRDLSYRNQKTAEEVTAVIQNQLLSDDFDWVERGQIKNAQKEFELQTMGFIDKKTALKQGKWLRADLAVLGTFSSTPQAKHCLTVEIADLKHAEILQQKTFVFSAFTNQTLSVATKEILGVAPDIRTMLEQVRISYPAISKQTRIALINFYQSNRMPPPSNFERVSYKRVGKYKVQVRSTGTTPYIRNDELDEPFVSALRKQVVAKPEFRLVQFGRLGEANGEISLVLDGAMESSATAWEDIADFYIWGSYEKKAEPETSISTNAWSFSVHVWDRQSPPVLITSVIAENSYPVTVANQLARDILAKTHPIQPQSSSATTRQKVAEILVDDQGVMSLDSSGDSRNSAARETWQRTLHSLEIARAIDPENQKIQETYLLTRWNNSSIDQIMDDSQFKVGRSELWKAYVKRFGFTSVLGTQRENIMGGYVESARETFQFANRQWEWNGVIPLDAGKEVIDKWRTEFLTEFIRRIREVAPLFQATPKASLNPCLVNWLLVMNHDFRNRPPGPDDQAVASMIESIWPYLTKELHASPALDELARSAIQNFFVKAGRATRGAELLQSLGPLPPKSAAEPPVSTRSAEKPLVLPRYREIYPHDRETYILSF